MTKPPKVTAHLQKPATIIDQDSGNVTVLRKGVMKGFGQALKEQIAKGNVFATVTTEVNTGKYPDDHPDPDKAGKWAVQIVLGGMDKESTAVALADRLTPILEGFLGGKALRAQ
jgi:hypothetical protein